VAATLLPAPTTRQRIARTALSAALAVDGVVAATPGRLRTHVTPTGDGLVQGVTVVAGAGSRFDVELFLVCRPVALRPLAEQVRLHVRSAAALAGLDSALGAVGVHFEDVEPAEGTAS